QGDNDPSSSFAVWLYPTARVAHSVRPGSKRVEVTHEADANEVARPARWWTHRTRRGDAPGQGGEPHCTLHAVPRDRPRHQLSHPHRDQPRWHADDPAGQQPAAV